MAPRPFSNLASGYDYNDGSLTPRTPRSMAGRAEEGGTTFHSHSTSDDEDEEGLDKEYTSYAQQQAEPLLASSASATFPPTGYRSRGDEHTFEGEKAKAKDHGQPSVLARVWSWVPLIGGAVLAVVLLLLIILSLKEPEVLEKVVSTNATLEDEAMSGNLSFSSSVLPTTSHASSLKAVFSPAATAPSAPAHHDHGNGVKTINYENYTEFPLTAWQYLHECNVLTGGFMSHSGYWTAMKGMAADVPHHDYIEDHSLPEGERTGTCKSTITYMLDGTIGLAADLALMAQAAALARERNRTFLVDDSRWNRGKWTDHFQDVRGRQPGPEPGCRAPAPEELVACPRVARHWVITSRTAMYHFAGEFDDNYQDPYQRSLNRWMPIFKMARTSLEQTIRPNAENAALIRSARTEIAASLQRVQALQEASANSSQYIATHVRRGDKHAQSWAHHNGYIPISEYADAVNQTWERLQGDAAAAAGLFPFVYVATDSPDAQTEFMGDLPGGTKVFSLAQSTDPSLRALASKNPYYQDQFNNLTHAERVNATRGVVVDLAMVSGLWAWPGEVQPMATVCTIGSAICKLSAIGLGWERAFGYGDPKESPTGETVAATKRWIEIDNKGSVEPEWKAFDLSFSH